MFFRLPHWLKRDSVARWHRRGNRRTDGKATNDVPQHARAAAEWIGKQVVDHWNAKDEKLFRRITQLDRYFKACAPVYAQNR